jgi:ATP-binding cassette subfamily C (CFTR/MRP) protein 4
MISYALFQSFLQVIGIVIVSCVINPWVVLAAVPLVVVFILLRRFYLRTSRAIKRIEGAGKSTMLHEQRIQSCCRSVRSPVLSHLTSTILGLHSVRSYGVQSIFLEEFYRHQDLHTSAWFLYISTMRCFVYYLDSMCAVFISVVSLSSVAAAESKHLYCCSPVY